METLSETSKIITIGLKDFGSLAALIIISILIPTTGLSFIGGTLIFLLTLGLIYSND